MSHAEMGMAFAIGLGSIWADTMLRIALHFISARAKARHHRKGTK